MEWRSRGGAFGAQRIKVAQAELERLAQSRDAQAPEHPSFAEALTHLRAYANHAATALDRAAVDVNMGMMKMQSADEAYQGLRTRLSALVDLQHRQSDAGFAEARTAKSRALAVCAVLFLPAVGASMAAGMIMSRKITTPLKSAAKVAERIAVGDLRSEIEARGSDVEKISCIADDNLRTVVEAVETAPHLDGLAANLNESIRHFKPT